MVTLLTVPHVAKCCCTSSGVAPQSTLFTKTDRPSASSLLPESGAASSSTSSPGATPCCNRHSNDKMLLYESKLWCGCSMINISGRQLQCRASQLCGCSCQAIGQPQKKVSVLLVTRCGRIVTGLSNSDAAAHAAVHLGGPDSRYCYFKGSMFDQLLSASTDLSIAELCCLFFELFELLLHCFQLLCKRRYMTDSFFFLLFIFFFADHDCFSCQTLLVELLGVPSCAQHNAFVSKCLELCSHCSPLLPKQLTSAFSSWPSAPSWVSMPSPSYSSSWNCCSCSSAINADPRSLSRQITKKHGRCGSR